MELITSLLGQNGLIFGIGAIIFFASYMYSIQIFDFIEKYTYGTRTHILEQAELLFWEVNPDHVTYILLFLSFGLGTIVCALMGFFVSWGLGLFLGIVISIIGWKIPRPFMKHLVDKRIRGYQSQMVDALQLLSNGLRAGLSFPQAVGMAGSELPAPVSEEFNMILQQNRIGVPIEECLENLAVRVPTQDNDMFVASISILMETGGNLAETFDIIIDVIRERIRVQQKIDTYVAQGMFQGYTLFAMPFMIGGMYMMSDPQTMMILFKHPLGWVLLGAALILDFIGLFFILKLVQIKV